MAEATRTRTVVVFNTGSIKGVVATVSTFTTADTCTFTSGLNTSLGTILWAAAFGASALVSTNVAASTVTFGSTSATVNVFAVGF